MSKQEFTILQIAKALIRYSPAKTKGILEESDVQKAVCAAKKAFDNFGIQIHINSEACIGARTTLRKLTYEQLYNENQPDQA